MINDYDTFYDEVKDYGGVLRLTIPTKLAKFAGLKGGDRVRVLIAKEGGALDEQTTDIHKTD